MNIQKQNGDYELPEEMMGRLGRATGMIVKPDFEGGYDSFHRNVRQRGLIFYGEEGIYAIFNYPNGEGERPSLQDVTSKLGGNVRLPEDVLLCLEILFLGFDRINDVYREPGEGE